MQHLNLKFNILDIAEEGIVKLEDKSVESIRITVFREKQKN